MHIENEMRMDEIEDDLLNEEVESINKVRNDENI